MFDMVGRNIGSVTRRAIGVALIATMLTGCSAMTIGSGAGPKVGQVAEVANIASYSAEQALVSARAHFKNGDYGHAAALYKRAVEVAPQDPEGFVGLGASYDRLRRFDLSDRIYAALLKLTGPNVQYYNNVGYSNMLRGNLPVALASFRKAQALDPGNAVVANNIALLSAATAKRG